MPILVTGAAGFIGFHVCRGLLEQGRSVVGIDNFTDYYDVRLKEARVAELRHYDAFELKRVDIADPVALQSVFESPPSHVINLAAQPGVRYSLKNPSSYVHSNLEGFLNVLECCRQAQVQHLVYASSSSVYGANRKLPFSVEDRVDHPISLYAATKKANELMAHSYSALFDLPTTGLRFFTVYGPWGRPDMAVYSFTRAISLGEPIQVFNEGHMLRDFTYVDDIVEAVSRLVDQPARPNPAWNALEPAPASSWAPYRLYNIGNHTSVALMYLIELIEKGLGKKAQMQFLPMQPGDLEATFADVDSLVQAVGFHPSTPIETGIERFVAWYRHYHGLS